MARTGGLPNGFDDLVCALTGIGCDGDGGTPTVDVDMHLWINAASGHDDLAVCRVKLDDAAGEIEIVTDGGSPTTMQVNHTGKDYTTVGIFVDTGAAGWYGVAIASDEGWSPTGCTVDEV